MSNKSSVKKTHRTDKERTAINNRLNRIEGQIRGIKKMVLEDSYCNDILIQLSSVEKSVKSLSNYMLENHLRGCVAKDLESGKLKTFNEVVNLLKKFNSEG